MSPEEKIKTYFHMQSRDKADRVIFDQIVHDDIVVIDSPVGVTTQGKEAVWAVMDIPPEQKSGPDTFSFKADFIEYIGNEQEGFARWSFCPTGNLGFLWGKNSVVFDESASPVITIAIRVKFEDGKIIFLDEYWNPVPLLQKLGFDIPSPRIPE